MRILFIILLLLSPFLVFAVSGQNSVYTFSLGEPIVTADATSECNSSPFVVFTFNNGSPATAYDATAMCASATVEPAPSSGFFKDADVRVKDGALYFK